MVTTHNRYIRLCCREQDSRHYLHHIHRQIGTLCQHLRLLLVLNNAVVPTAPSIVHTHTTSYVHSAIIPFICNILRMIFFIRSSILPCLFPVLSTHFSMCSSVSAQDTVIDTDVGSSASCSVDWVQLLFKRPKIYCPEVIPVFPSTVCLFITKFLQLRRFLFFFDGCVVD